MRVRDYSIWVVYRYSDAVEQWIGHCLDLDVLSQGPTLGDAREMVADAIREVLIDDLNGGFDPMDRRAPRECWDELFEIVTQGKRVSFDETDSKCLKVAAMLEFRMMQVSAKEAPEVQPEASSPIDVAVWTNAA